MAATNIRIPDHLHQVLRVAAAARGISLQRWIVAELELAALRQAAQAGGSPVAAALKDAGIVPAEPVARKRAAK
jgi:hypothetical protein